MLVPLKTHSFYVAYITSHILCHGEKKTHNSTLSKGQNLSVRVFLSKFGINRQLALFFRAKPLFSKYFARYARNEMHSIHLGGINL